MDRNVYIKFKLALQDKTLLDLSDFLGMHRNSLYLKLNGKVPFSQEEINLIVGYLKLTPMERELLAF